MEQGANVEPNSQQLKALAIQLALRDEMNNSMSKKQVYLRVSQKYLLPSYSSRCMSTDYMKIVMFVPRSFKIALQDWEAFVAEMGG